MISQTEKVYYLTCVYTGSKLALHMVICMGEQIAPIVWQQNKPGGIIIYFKGNTMLCQNDDHQAALPLDMTWVSCLHKATNFVIM